MELEMKDNLGNIDIACVCTYGFVCLYIKKIIQKYRIKYTSNFDFMKVATISTECYVIILLRFFIANV